MKTLVDYFNQRNDLERLQSYEKYDTLNEETLNLLVEEYFLGLPYDTRAEDLELTKSFSTVIDYLFDCYNG